MRDNPNTQRKLYARLYAYSKEYLPYKWLEQRFGIKSINQKELSNNLVAYGFCVFASVLAYLITSLFRHYPDKALFYIFYIILVALSGSIGGRNPALLTTGMISSVAFFLFNNSNVFSELNIDLSLQIVVFVIGAFIIIFLIDRIRNTDFRDKLKKQEKAYAKAFVELHDNHRKAQEAIKARDEFLTVVSHELRTPLTTMLLKLHSELKSIHSVSLANFSVPQLMKVLKDSEIQINHLTVIINDLLDISLITTGRMELKPERTDLVKITKIVIENFSALLKNQKNKVEIEAKSPVTGTFDKVRIEQAITNLVSNAIKYGKRKPIEIRIFNDKNTAYFIIKDQGIGISSRDQALVFDLFRRTKQSGGHSNSLGVGLYITSQIVKAHGGEVKVSSKPLEGSTFSLKLPIK